MQFLGLLLVHTDVLCTVRHLASAVLPTPHTGGFCSDGLTTRELTHTVRSSVAQCGVTGKSSAETNMNLQPQKE